MSQNNHHDSHHSGTHQHHITPVNVYIKTFAMLILLTIATVVTSYFDFGVANLAIAMAIACTKASFVILFFMQLKYDDITNKVTFYASFLFLGIFLTLTASDFVFRTQTEPLKVEQVAGAGGGETDVTKLSKPTPELVAEGKALFAVQCTSCHGPNGGGDGPAAAALNPKPRNFLSGYWKYGGQPSIIFRTVSQGSPGTAMAAFTTLTVQQRFALAHYVHSIAKPTPPEDTPETIKQAEAVVGNAAKTTEVPVDVAMESMEEPDQVVLPGEEKNPGHPGAQIFELQCAQCHGVGGQGAEVKSMGVNPVTVLTTRNLAGMGSASWAQSENEFIKLVSEGIPGEMPGMSHYTAQEWSALFSYVRGLTAK